MEWNFLNTFSQGSQERVTIILHCVILKLAQIPNSHPWAEKHFNLYSLHQGQIIVQVTHSVEKHMNCKESQGHFKPSLVTFYPFELVSDFSYLSLNFYLCKKMMIINTTQDCYEHQVIYSKSLALCLEQLFNKCFFSSSQLWHAFTYP